MINRFCADGAVTIFKHEVVDVEVDAVLRGLPTRFGHEGVKGQYLDEKRRGFKRCVAAIDAEFAALLGAVHGATQTGEPGNISSRRQIHLVKRTRQPISRDFTLGAGPA